MDAVFKGHGFVYWEVATSCDGAYRVLEGYSGGEKSPTIVEPRIIEVSSGEVVVDLWHTYRNYSVEFRESGAVRLRIEDPRQSKSRFAILDLVNRTFVFEDSPQTHAPLSELSNRLHFS